MRVDCDHRLFLAQDYALINPMQVGPEARQDLRAIPVVPVSLQKQERLMPLLLPLKTLSESERLDLLYRSDEWFRHHELPLFSALWVAPVESKVLLGHLCRMMVQRRKDGSAFWLRYHDPRVFRHLLWILSPPQLGTLFGVVKRWTWYDTLSCQWYQSERCQANSALLGLKREQEDALYRLGALNALLRDLLRQLPESQWDTTALQQLDRELRLAFEQAGLEDEADRRLYAEQSYRFSSKIHQHPELMARLRQANMEGCTYYGACQDLDDETMCEFVAELAAL